MRRVYGWLPELWLERAGEEHFLSAVQRIKGSGQWLHPAQKVIKLKKGYNYYLCYVSPSLFYV